MKRLSDFTPATLLDTARKRGLKGSLVLGLRYLSHRLPIQEKRKFDFRWDNYLMWLNQCVPGMLEPGNVSAIAYALQHLPDKTSAIVEIGSFSGLSTCIFGYLRAKFGVTNPMYNCDRWEFDGQRMGEPLGGAPHVTHNAYREFVRASYERDVKTFYPGKLPSTIEAYSDTFFEWWGEKKETMDFFGQPAQLGGPLAFCFIDGDHSYDFTRRDFENTDRFLVPGGFILFDDSAEGTLWWEVRKVVAEVLASGKYELIGKTPNYLVQKKR